MVEKIKKEFSTILFKAMGEKMLVTGVVAEPDSIDTQGDLIPIEEIEKACHSFMLSSQLVGLQHLMEAPARVVESYICPIDWQVSENEMVKKGSWVITVKVQEPEIWRMIKSGEFTGFSIGGFAKRTPV